MYAGQWLLWYNRSVSPNIKLRPSSQDVINTQVIYQFAYAQVKYNVSVLLSNCKQSITSLSLLVGTTEA